MKYWQIMLIGFLLSGCSQRRTAAQKPTLIAKSTHTSIPLPNTAVPEGLRSTKGLHDFGPAPELTNEVWFNTDRPIRIADLRGKVVIVDMWTFG